MPQESISVKVHPNASKDVLVSTGPGRFEAWIRAKPIEGRANEVVLGLLAQGLRIPREQLRLVKGRMGRHKVFRVVG